MFLSILNSLDSWFYQTKSLIVHRFNHMSPQDYSVMLVISIAVGFVLLRGKR